MTEKYLLDNGWLVERQHDNTPIIHIKPIPNTIFKSNLIIQITDEIYEAISLGETDLKNLFEEFKLHMLIMEQSTKRVDPTTQVKTNSETIYHGSDFVVSKENDNYYLRYRLSRQGDGERIFEISHEIYEDARRGKFSTSDLFAKYNLYHLDVDANDI